MDSCLDECAWPKPGRLSDLVNWCAVRRAFRRRGRVAVRSYHARFSDYYPSMGRQMSTGFGKFVFGFDDDDVLARYAKLPDGGPQLRTIECYEFRGMPHRYAVMGVSEVDGIRYCGHGATRASAYIACKIQAMRAARQWAKCA